MSWLLSGIVVIFIGAAVVNVAILVGTVSGLAVITVAAVVAFLAVVIVVDVVVFVVVLASVATYRRMRSSLTRSKCFGVSSEGWAMHFSIVLL